MNFAGLAVAMIVGALGIVGINLYSGRDFVEQSLLKRARAHHGDIMMVQRWSTGYGGVFVEQKAGDKTLSSVDQSVVKSVDGRVFTLRNPAQMTRELSDLSKIEGRFKSHITSSNPLNPENAPDEWERAALARFVAGDKEFFGRVADPADGQRTLFRYMAPLHVDESCQGCHQYQQYRIGEVRGGISISFDVSETEAVFRDNALATGVAMLLILLGVGQLTLLSLHRVRRIGRAADRERKRFESLVQTTEGIVWEADASTHAFTFVSDRAEAILGYPLADWRQPRFWVEHLHPDDRPWSANYCRLCTEGSGSIEFEYRFIACDGRVVWLHDLVAVIEEEGQAKFLRGLTIDITARKENELLARKVEAEQRAILENAMVGIVYVRHRTVVTCNPRFEEIFGYAAGELNGQSTRRLFSSDTQYQSFGADAAAAIGRGESFGCETLLCRQDGRLFWGAISGRAIDPGQPDEGSIWIYADISERKQAAEEAGKLLRAVEQSPVSIVITDREGTIEYVNPRFCQVSGYSRAEAIGRNPRLLRSGLVAREVYADLWLSILSGKEWRGTLQNRRKSGEVFWEEASIAPVLNSRGEITNFIAVKEDITERMGIENELAQYRSSLEDQVVERTRDLVLAMQKATAADRAKSEFLTNMSHEIRTPLNAVIGFCRLAMRTNLTEQQRDYLDKIDGAGQHLLQLINNLLDLSKIAAGKVELIESEFDLLALLDKLSSVFSSKAAEKGLSLGISVDPQIPARLLGDALRLNQVLLNLLANAIKFTEHGTVTVVISRIAPVPANAEPFDPVHQVAPVPVRIAFSITDTGIGMDEAELTRAFEPFSQGDASITRKYGGTGLGLAISRQLVELMGGQLVVDSRKGVGSRFGFEIGLRQAGLSGLAVAPAVDTDRQGAAALRFDNVRVLLVEDQPLNRQVAEELLKANGIVVETAGNGREAVDLLFDRGPLAFDLVLMDLQMPEYDGLSAMREIRSRPEFARLPMVAMTAHVLEEEKAGATAAGANDHLGKPFDPDQLYATVARWVAPAKVRRGRSAAHADTGRSRKDATRLLGESSPVLDWPAGLERFDGRLDRYVGWLGRFADERRNIVAELEQSVRRGELAAATHEAHALKGLSGTLGLTRVFQAGRELEQALRAARDEGIRDSLDALRDVFDEAICRVDAALAAWKCAQNEIIGPDAAGAPASIQGSVAALVDALERLDDLLQRGDGNSVEWMDECMARARGLAMEPAVAKIREAVDHFDFRSAAAQLGTLRQSLQKRAGAPA